MRGRGRAAFERALPQFFARSRWYAGKARTIRGLETLDVVALASTRARQARARSFLVLIQVEYGEGEPETYVLAVTVADPDRAEELLADHPNCGIAWIDVRSGGERLFLHDALVDPAFMASALDAFRARRTFPSMGGGELRATVNAHFRRAVGDRSADDLVGHPLGVDQSNTSIAFGQQVLVKMFRRAQEGVNPDLEIGRFLTETAEFEHSPALLGALEYRKGSRREPRTIAVLSDFVPNEGDAWAYTLDQLGLFYESANRFIPDAESWVPPWPMWLESIGWQPSAAVADALGPYVDAAELLGRRTAELHYALASGVDEAFAPEPFTTLYQRSLYQSMRAQVRPTLTMVRRRLRHLDERTRPLAEALLTSENQILERFSELRSHRFDVHRIRVHGDYHLGQVLRSGREFVIVDFEGEPSRSPTERRIKRSALSDVAGMVRSFQYARQAALRELADRGLLPPEQYESMHQRGRIWQYWVTVRFLTGYFEAAEGADFVPSDPVDLASLLTTYTLDKALYEVRYEMSHRPDWAAIPISGVLELVDGSNSS